MHKIAKIFIVGTFLFAIFPVFPVSAKKSASAQGIRIKNGQIATINYDTKIITATKNGTTYTIDATNAVVKRRYGATAAFSEMLTGDYIWVWGTIDGTNITARKIRDNSIQKWKATFAGTITAINNFDISDPRGNYHEFTLQSRHRGVQTVRLYSTTRIKYKRTSLTFTDLAVGETITAKGIWNNTHSIVYNTAWIKIKKLVVGD
jgi:hypothetical protein